MKALSMIAVAGILVIAFTVIGAFVGKLGSMEAHPYAHVTISGLQESYVVREPIAFAVAIEGYGTACGDVNATIAKDGDAKYVLPGWYVSASCASDVKLDYFKFNALSVSTRINQTGNYTVMVSFDDLAARTHVTTGKKFSVTGDKIVLNANGGRPLGIAMHVKELDIDMHAVDADSPVTLHAGENATFKIEMVSQIPKPASLQMRVFNNDEISRDLAFARVKFNGDVSGLPDGLTASFGKDVIMLDANASGQETLTFAVGKNAKPGSYQIGVIALVTMNDTAGTEMGNSQTLWIPVVIK